MESGRLNAAISSYCVLACVILKVPQILVIIRSKNVKGLSLNGLLLEFWCFSLQISYNVCLDYPLQNYFEYVFLVIQDVVLLLLLFHYLDTPIPLCIVYFMGFFTVNSLVAGNYFPASVVSSLFSTIIPCNVLSRVTQAQKIVSTRDSGSVSSIPYMVAVTTSAGRIYTTATTTGDTKVILTSTVAICTSLLVVGVATYYRKPQQKRE